MVDARLRAGLSPSTGYTIVVPELLREELARVRQRGYARSVDETEIGMSSLAVPVHVPLDGPVVAAISMIGPTIRLIGDHEAHHVSVLQAGARSLSESIEKGEFSLRRRRP
jgi:DNA-binding IclR family transcriptional regulator